MGSILGLGGVSKLEKLIIHVIKCQESPARGLTTTELDYGLHVTYGISFSS
jgi:hypothetical protein